MLEQDVRVRFVDYSELVVFCLGILIVVFLLFPRERIEWLIGREEDTNLDLSILYIENLLSVNPDDRMKLSLAKKYLRIEDYGKAEELLEELEESPLGHVRFEAFSLRYEVLKKKYFAGHKELRGKIEDELRKAINRSEDIKTLRTLYRESLSMNMPHLALLAAEKLSGIDIHRAYWASEAYRQALATSNLIKAAELAGKLSDVDRRRRTHWLREGMRVAMALKDYGLAEHYLEELGAIKKDVRWYNKAAELYLLENDYRRAMDAYIAAMRLEKGMEKKFRHLRRAIEVALWHEDYQEVKRLVRSHGRRFLGDDEMAEFVLNAALATGDTAFARKIALDILEHFEEKTIR